MYECKIAEKLVELRTRKGVTQEEVAQSLSVSNKTVSKWENGASTPELGLLVELARYYEVSTDVLLGLAEEKKQSIREVVCAEFEGLSRKDAVQKAFTMVKSVIPAIYEGKVPQVEEADKSSAEEIAVENPQYSRLQLAMDGMYEFVTNSEEVNVAVMLLRNNADFAWLGEAEKQKEIVRVFRFLSQEDALSVLYFVLSKSCAENFTVDYVAKHTNVTEERVKEILNEFCSVGECSQVTAHLEEGEKTVYECYGDGILLSVISLVYEKMCGRKAYEYNMNGNCKLIGGK